MSARLIGIIEVPMYQLCDKYTSDSIFCQVLSLNCLTVSLLSNWLCTMLIHFGDTRLLQIFAGVGTILKKNGRQICRPFVIRLKDQIISCLPFPFGALQPSSRQ